MKKGVRIIIGQIRLLPVLLLCAALLFGVKLGGIWDGVGGITAGIQQAKAEAPATDEAQAKASVQSTPDAAAAGAGAMNDISSMNESEVALLQKLSERRQQLDAQAKKLETRESLLGAAEKRLDERINRLKEIEASIDALIERFDKQEEGRIAKLVQVYESMKPKSAAAIFDQLDIDILLAVAKRMDEAKMAEVLSKMTPEAAKRLTVEMANQKKLPDTAS